MKKICFVAASPLTLRVFMRNHILCLAEEYEITAIANFSSDDLINDWLPGVRLVSMPIERNISLLTDMIALLKLVRFFYKEAFDSVHSITPKAGLLSMTAARVTRIPIRIHNLSGQIWVTRHGLFRRLLKYIDSITFKNSTNLLSDSFSQITFLHHEGLVEMEQVEVLGNGSVCGIDPDRFHPCSNSRRITRDNLEIPESDFVIIFVGRLNRDKGILDLAQAFSQLAHYHDDIWLVVLGDCDEDIINDFNNYCGDALTRVRLLGNKDSPEHYMTAGDILALPSYRESFGVSIIEGAACGLPSVASRIVGITDATIENITGLMHPPGDVEKIRDCFERLYMDSELRLRLGNAAMKRVQNDFSMQQVSNEFVSYYRRNVGKN